MHKITDRMKELLNYDSESGIFTWKVNRRSVKAGDVAGHKDGRGYIIIGIDGEYYLAHRLAWLYVYGEWPEPQTDHKNLDKSDNRIANLRVATAVQNGQNKPIFKNNKSGVAGVSWNSRDNVWQTHIRKDGRLTHVGYFDNLFEAAAARFSAENKHYSHRTIRA
jgi:HNH endonuclease